MIIDPVCSFSAFCGAPSLTGPSCLCAAQASEAVIDFVGAILEEGLRSVEKRVDWLARAAPRSLSALCPLSVRSLSAPCQLTCALLGVESLRSLEKPR